MLWIISSLEACNINESFFQWMSLFLCLQTWTVHHWFVVLSVQFSCSVVSNSLWPHELQHARPPCPSPTPRVYSNPCSLNQWCHPAISSSVVPFSSCPQSFPASGSFPMSQLFAWGSQSIEVSASASVLPMNTQDWSPLGWTGWISLQSKRLSRVFSNTIVQKHHYFSSQLSSLGYFRRTLSEWQQKARLMLTMACSLGVPQNLERSRVHSVTR